MGEIFHIPPPDRTLVCTHPPYGEDGEYNVLSINQYEENEMPYLW